MQITSYRHNVPHRDRNPNVMAGSNNQSRQIQAISIVGLSTLHSLLRLFFLTNLVRLVLTSLVVHPTPYLDAIYVLTLHHHCLRSVGISIGRYRE